MKPRGPLMTEHRLIEKMLNIIRKELDVIKNNNTLNSAFIDTIVDFIQIYADRTHHGKEEDILFTKLHNKKLNPEDERMMRELTDEHAVARKMVSQLIEANIKYAGGDSSSIKIIVDTLSELIVFYPPHISKEDKIFFPDTEKYFSNAELDEMLNEFWEFDKKMIHEKYNAIYESLKERYA